jgi:hypothetical protein
LNAKPLREFAGASPILHQADHPWDNTSAHLRATPAACRPWQVMFPIRQPNAEAAA